MAEDILDTVPHDPPSDQSTPGNNIPNGKTNHYAADPEAQEMVIESLRGQIQDLFSQVTQLNSKLVKSYDRVSDLEDNLHVTSSQLRNSTVKISQLELERTQHLAALNTGLLVEKHHVTTELNRLMEKATEEAAQRGQAESARVAIEKDLDDLSASLFNQANTMVAEARYARHVSEKKAVDAEQALKSAEEAVSAMQQQVQILQEDKETAEQRAAEMQTLMGSSGGNWVARKNLEPLLPSLRLFASHLPYQEFLSFVAHLRQLHMSTSSHPAMATLLSLPFLTRLSTEDSEPTLRLDIAPSLSWLSRRSVLAAIHTGQLTIEPMSFATLIAESPQLSNAGISAVHNENIPCALCGALILPQTSSTNTSPTRPPSNPLMSRTHSYSGSIGSASAWSTSLFKKTPAHSTPPPAYSIFNSRTNQPSSTPIYPSQVYIFRISSNQISSNLPSLQLLKSSAPTGTPSGSSMPSSSIYTPPSHGHPGGATPSQSNSTIYPLCTSGWCLARLRLTCSLWAFVRTGIVEKIWEEEIYNIPDPGQRSLSGRASTSNTQAPGASGAEKSPRRKGLWGFASAIGASWGESANDKDKTRKPSSPSRTSEKDEKKEVKPRTLPPPPPRHPQEHGNMTPPPLPRRSEGRARTPLPSSTPEPIVASETTTQSPQLSEDHISEGNASTTALIGGSITSPELPSLGEKLTASPELPSPSLAVTSAPTPPISPNRAQHIATPSTPPPPIPPRAAKRLSASFARPGTPSNIPLPESRPDTPVIGPGAVPNPPSRTASPAVGSTPGTDAPPPIPKRAASRRRLTGENDPRPESPVASGSPVKSHEGQAQNETTLTSPSQTQLDTVKEAVEEVKPEDKDTETMKFTESPIQVKATQSVGSSTTMTSEEVFLDAEDRSMAVEEDTVDQEKEDEAEVKTVKDEKETKESLEEDKKEETVDGGRQLHNGQPPISLNEDDLTVPSYSAPSYPASPPRLPPRRSEPVNGSREVEKAKSLGSDNGSEISEEEEGVYIGDSTWEEKVWKELTKLREGMYWARIGAVRP